MHDRERAVINAEDAEANPLERIYGLSVECFLVSRIDEALRATQRPNSQVRITTASRIREAGMDVIPTMEPPHATLCIPKPLDEAAWNLLQRVFDEPIRNPYARKRS